MTTPATPTHGGVGGGEQGWGQGGDRGGFWVTDRTERSVLSSPPQVPGTAHAAPQGRPLMTEMITAIGKGTGHPY